MYTGGCVCGAVRYKVSAAPINQRICHCRICQKAIGAAFNARLLFHAADVELSGPVKQFHSSPELQRGFCAECGTSIFSYREGKGTYGITTGSLDDPSLFKPELHMWVESKQPWIAIDDALPQYMQAPPA